QWPQAYAGRMLANLGNNAECGQGHGGTNGKLCHTSTKSMDLPLNGASRARVAGIGTARSVAPAPLGREEWLGLALSRSVRARQDMRPRPVRWDRPAQ